MEIPPHIPENILSWQARRKQLLRQKLCRNYVWLTAATLLFGFLIIGLNHGSWPAGRDEKSALEVAQPTAAQLEQITGQYLSAEQLAQHWGESRRMPGSSAELELRYFFEAKVYLLRRQEYVVYAGKRRP